jgi:hypothetical protein
MVPSIWIGALLVIGGVLFMARAAILRGKMSNPHAGATLEPDRRSLRFLGVSANWPGIVLISVGGWMLLWGAL